ncbi:PilC/PilY family type IV pilus protein [Kushneria indalinina]|uniref:Type IV pilus assembly protein PilY1 n=1 Tax=Kushneria indalinina DSM 14324 TaxID=1122140 RepID=A0A3D9DW26_9GAMM|nr:PilC/PilY family type IV pilus protein [Kushneria indalinina]REC94544.1 type IV pilus assembly protein PilY1 [Kushneria indalinina DSM 14324]
MDICACKRWQRRLSLAVLAACLMVSSVIRADDVDIYLPAYQASGGGGQPQVMLIIDTSASMNTTLPGSNKTRIGITREVLSSLVRQHPGINFSIAVFNDNNWVGRKDAYDNLGENGGRVIQGFPFEPRQSGDARNALLTTINSRIAANTTTPLCETMSEVYRYFTGSQVLYGKENTRARPVRDTGIETGNGTYRSPMRPCEQVYVIYMTDGQPLMDTQANDFIEKLTGKSCRFYDAAVPNTDNMESVKNCLPQLTRFMAEHDLGDGRDKRPDLAGTQRAYTFTIGFTTQQSLLEDAAQPPPGISQGYYEANDRDGLDLAFSRILGSIIENEIQTQRFSTATNIEGTENLGQVYSPGFLPRGYVPWTGNLKKFAVDKSQPSNPIKRDFWSRGITEIAAPDAVEQGGAGARIREQVRTGRQIYTDIGKGAVFTSLARPGARQDLDTDGIDGRALGVLEQTRYTPRQLADWVYGLDVTNDSETDIRPWVMGDIVHSQPLAINYGCAESRSDCPTGDQRIRIFVGTNEGLLHAIDDTSGAERWAFWPRETAGMAVYRMLNTRPEYPWPKKEGGLEYLSQSTHYGVDGSPGAWLAYNTTLDAAGQRRVTLENAVLAFGFGRGGRGYYGLNVINPDEPKPAWHVLESEWGQSWSTPVAVTLADGRPAFLAGMGHDITAGSGANRGPARFGTGMVVIDAQRGTIIASLKGPADSVPATITPVDRDFDGTVDGAFFGDTGGNVWFADLRLGDDGRNKKRTPADWQLHQVAALGRHDQERIDRAFFNRANLVRTYLDQNPVDLLMLGSGDRANPLISDSRDAFYILEVSRWLDGSHNGKTPAILNNNDLVEAPVQASTYTLGAPVDREGYLDMQAFRGWRLMLPAGMKVLSDASTIAGNTLFTTYHPEVPLDMCMAARGASRLYGFSLPVWRDNGHRHEQRAATVKSADMGRYLQETPAFLIEGLRTRVLDSNRADLVADVLKDDRKEPNANDDDSCGQYDVVDGAFRECLVTAPLWWYQQ